MFPTQGRPCLDWISGEYTFGNTVLVPPGGYWRYPSLGVQLGSRYRLISGSSVRAAKVHAQYLQIPQEHPDPGAISRHPVQSRSRLMS